MEEYLNQYYVQHYEEIDAISTNKVIGLKKLQNKWFYQTALGYVLNNGKALYLINKDGLPDEVKKNLKGGDAGNKTYVDYANLNDVYGVTSDLHVYYSSGGLDNAIGISSEDELEEDDTSRTVAKVESSSIGSAFGGYDTDKNGTITSLEARAVKTADINCNGISSINEIGDFINLKTLILRNATLDNLEGIERCSSLYYIFFDNCNIKDYSKLSELRSKLTHLILYNIDDNELNTFCSIEKGIGVADTSDKSKDFSLLNYFAITGNSNTTYMFSVTTPGNYSSSSYNAGGGKASKTITTLSSLNNLSDVTKLSVRYLCVCNNNLNNLSGIENFENLYMLRAEYNLLTDVSALTKFSNLRYLNVQNNQLTELPYITNNNLVNIIAPSNIINTLSNLSNANSLTNLWIWNNKLGYSIDTSSRNPSNDALSSLKSKTSLYILDIRNNSNLNWVDYISSNTNLRYLQMNGCTSMVGTSFSQIKSIINNCIYVNYPDAYALSLIDENAKNLSLKNQTIKKSVFESLIPIYDSSDNLISGCPNLTQLELSNLTITDEAGNRLDQTTANVTINNVLSNLRKLSNLAIYSSRTSATARANYSTGDLSTIDFVGQNKVTLLETFVLWNTDVIDLANLNNYSTKLYNLVLYSNNKSFSFLTSQTTLNNLYNNYTQRISDGLSTENPFSSSYSGHALAIKCGNIYAKLAGLSELKGLICYPDGEFGQNVTVDLSGCTKLTSIEASRGFSGVSNLILPASLTYYHDTWGVINNCIDFSRCVNLQIIQMVDNNIPNYAMADNTFKTIKQLFDNNSNVKLKEIQFIGRSFDSFKSLDFLQYLKGYNIETFRFTPHERGYYTNMDFSGIKYLTNLKNLYLACSTEDDLTWLIPTYDETTNELLTGCPNLKVISFDFMKYITNLNVLGNLTNLTSITAVNCCVNNIYELKNLSYLTYLNLQNNSLNDVSTYTDLNGNSKNYNVLELLANMNQNKSGKLNTLYLNGNSFQDLTKIQDSSLKWTNKNGF